jgi:hypothetical protein
MTGQQRAQTRPDTGAGGQGQQGPGDALQQPPANDDPADPDGLDLDQLAGYGATFATHAGKAALGAFAGAVVIGGGLALAAAAGPVAGGVAAAAGLVLLGAFVYELGTQAKEIYSGQDRGGATLSTNDRVGIAGDAVGSAVGAFLGGKSLEALGNAFSARAPETTPGSQECAGDQCFPAGTLVATENGPKAIERIVADERVWALDLKTEKWRLCRVTESLDRFHVGDYVGIDLNAETIESTGGHPFWVVAGEGLSNRPQPDHVDALEPGAAAPGQWVDARDLRAGDLLLQRSGDVVKIRRIRSYTHCLRVFNLHVAELQSYAVGFSQVLTHNYPGEGGTGGGDVGVDAPNAQQAKGGTYKLVDPDTGQVMRTGRSGNLAQRQAQHARDPELSDYDFEVDRRTDIYAQQRGREQIIHDQYDPPLNKIRPIRPDNPNRQKYLDAGQELE